MNHDGTKFLLVPDPDKMTVRLIPESDFPPDPNLLQILSTAAIAGARITVTSTQEELFTEKKILGAIEDGFKTVIGYREYNIQFHLVLQNGSPEKG